MLARRRRPRLAPALVVLLPLLALAALAVVAQDRVLWRIGTAGPGLYRSATLPEHRLDELVAEHGIRTIVNLRHTDVEADRAVAERHGARYVQLPVPQIPDAEQVARFLEILDDPASRPALLHCMHGIGRTGIFSAIARMEYDGWTADRAIEEAQDRSLGAAFGPHDEKTAWLRAYVPRRLRKAP